jgi:membrane-associated protease RseP (regulator of RpoE activity)
VLENFIKKPVAGAKVSLFSIAASREDSKETEIIGAVTEENGSYKISGVIEGSYTLKVSKPGYRTLEIPSFSTPGNGSLKVAPLALSPGADPLPEQDEPQAADKPSLTFGAGGFHVSLIHPGSQAGKAGMRDGDVIFSINGKTLDGMPGADAKALLGGSKGDTVLIGVLRDGERIELNVPLRLVSP